MTDTPAMKWLYLIHSNHYIKIDDDFHRLIGFGITSNPERRVRSYIGSTGVMQEFEKLYLGPSDAIVEIEKIQKKTWKEYCIEYGEDWVLEWLHPLSGKTIADLEEFFDSVINKNSLPIQKVLDNHLPYVSGFGEPIYTMEDVMDNPKLYFNS